ncbi:hypothetical protein [Streptomyces sp. NPDC048411]|uniref:hypothetical protein n=1 Tax=Streptomyces sp. NPDC048411 TaxID=3157206 RepID=UPI003455E831
MSTNARYWRVDWVEELHDDTLRAFTHGNLADYWAGVVLGAADYCTAGFRA